MVFKKKRKNYLISFFFFFFIYIKKKQMAASLAYLFRILGWADTLGKKKGIFPAAISIV